jgi:hypothetical protein
MISGRDGFLQVVSFVRTLYVQNIYEIYHNVHLNANFSLSQFIGTCEDDDTFTIFE